MGEEKKLAPPPQKLIAVDEHNECSATIGVHVVAESHGTLFYC